MNETKHTPKPWKYSFESVDPDWAVVTDASGHIVANVNSESGPDIPPLVSTTMPKEANAALISAAPDMLEALDVAEKIIRTARRYFPKSIKNGNKFDLENACATVGKAIAKAKGGAQ